MLSIRFTSKFCQIFAFSANTWPRTQIFGYMAQIFGHSPVKYDIFDPTRPRPFQKIYLYCQFALLPNFSSNFAKYKLFLSIFGPRTPIFGLRTWIFGPRNVKYDIFDPAWPRPFQKYIIYIVNLLHFQIAHQYLPNIWFCVHYLAPGLKYLARWLKYFGPATSNMTYLIRPDLDLFKNISFMGSS